jgi:hypothetical protein
MDGDSASLFRIFPPAMQYFKKLLASARFICLKGLPFAHGKC